MSRHFLKLKDVFEFEQIKLSHVYSSDRYLSQTIVHQGFYINRLFYMTLQHGSQNNSLDINSLDIKFTYSLHG